eukprot:TRINITY_DN24982_c0_g1_i1.p1 TRINITY_DN24982_c0_g1~~TRINITY_DN24982_c0_g1_i1.p1  ORF type:complete len:404 (+),score=25.29 TRINITY_DN24982_c0_g1_i1:28-1239(+)
MAVLFLGLLACILFRPNVVGATDVLRRLAFGSCSKHDRDQPFWSDIASVSPEAFVWLGDAIYADTRVAPFYWVPSPLHVMHQRWLTQKNHSGYHDLRRSTRIYGTWDDHDYGNNNGDGRYSHKEESKQMFLDFLDEDPNSSRRTQDGVYAAYDFNPPERRVRLILLDLRYNRNTFDLMGDRQWEWLRSQLASSTARIHIIGSGIQFVADDRPVEAWRQYPAMRQRLLDMIAELEVPGVIFLSGDVHFAELSRIPCPGIGYPLYELTSSGMTHAWGHELPRWQTWLLRVGLPARFRVGHAYFENNWGLVEFDWDSEPQTVTLSAYGNNLSKIISQTLAIDELRRHSGPQCSPERVLQDRKSPSLIPFTFAALAASLILLSMCVALLTLCIRGFARSVSLQKKVA